MASSWCLVFALELIGLAGERGIGGEQPAQPHEGALDVAMASGLFRTLVAGMAPCLVKA